jgi:zinc protease
MFTSGDSFQMSNSTVYEYIHKKNKLRVLLCPVEGAAVCGYMRAVNAGSKDEAACVPMGAAHFIEHMSFRIQKGKIWSLASKGDVINAETNMDSTRFYVVHLPHQTEQTIEIDAQRFGQAAVPADKVSVERHAVMNELERGEQAGNKMFQTTSSVAILQHPYHHSTIGTMTDVKQTTALDMEHFRQKFYVPNNTTLIFCGAFDPEAILQHVDQHFGAMLMGNDCHPVHTQEPPQQGKRVVELNIEAPCPMICMAFRQPKGSTKDSLAMQCISRLTWYNHEGVAKSLLEDNTLHDVSTYSPRQFDPYLWFFHGTQERTSVEIRTKLEQQMFHLLQTFIVNPVSNVQLEGVKMSLRDDWNRSTESVTDMMNELGQGVSMGNWKDFHDRNMALDAVTPAFLQKVATNVFSKQNMTVTHVIPTVAKVTPVTVPTPMSTSKIQQAPLPANIQKISNGHQGWAVRPLSSATNILHVPRANYARVTLSARFDPSQHDLASLFVASMGNGTLNHGESTTSALMSLHAERNFTHDHEFVHMTMAMPIKSTMLKKASNIMFQKEWLHPELLPEHVELEKRHMIAEMQSLKHDQGFQVKSRFITSLFTGTSYDTPLDARIQQIRGFTAIDLCSFHKKWINKSSYITLVTPTTEIASALGEIFPTHKIDTHTLPDKLTWTSKTRKSQEQRIALPGYGSFQIMMGQTVAVCPDSKEAMALRCAAEILGGGMTGRLMHTVREQRGLGTYGLYAVMQSVSKTTENIFCIQGTFSPASLEEGLACTKQLVQEWQLHGVTPQELKNAKDRMIGSRTIMADTVDNLHTMVLKYILENKNPEHEFRKFGKMVHSLSLDDVNQAIREYIDPNLFTTIIIGPPK